jgi:hypothetical protein
LFLILYPLYFLSSTPSYSHAIHRLWSLSSTLMPPPSLLNPHTPPRPPGLRSCRSIDQSRGLKLPLARLDWVLAKQSGKYPCVKRILKTGDSTQPKVKCSRNMIQLGRRQKSLYTNENCCRHIGKNGRDLHWKPHRLAA